MIACRHSYNKNLIEVLLKYGANIEHENRNGFTALLTLCGYNRNKDILKILLEKNVNIEH